MLVIGLTGSIGSGKSTVSKYISDRGYTVIDADMISRNITEKGSDLIPKLVETFGEDIVSDDGSLDRKALGQIVFSDTVEKEKLEKIVTAKVVDIIGNRIDLLKEEGHEDPVFIDAPLLFETETDFLTDENWVVIATDRVRAKRVMNRDGFTNEEFKARDISQMSQEMKVLLGDKIIDNSGDKESLYKQLDYLLSELSKQDDQWAE